MFRALEKSKNYVFDVAFGKYVTHLSFKTGRLSQALYGLEFFFCDLEIPGIKLKLNRSYRVFTGYDTTVASVRTCTLKSIKPELTACYTLCSSSVFFSDDLEAVLPFEFVKLLRDLDEQETRPENLLLEGSWYVDEH